MTPHMTPSFLNKKKRKVKVYIYPKREAMQAKVCNIYPKREAMQAKVCQLVHFLHQHWVERETPETEDELIHNLEANLFMSDQHRANPASTHTPNEKNSNT